MGCVFAGISLLMCIITACNLVFHDYVPMLHKNLNLLVTWSPVDGFWDSKGSNLIPDHVI